MDATPPKVFISYSWDDEEHKAWVRDLATRLRCDGIDVTLDQWHAVPGDQLPAFMERAVYDNAFVLLICTPAYKLSLTVAREALDTKAILLRVRCTLRATIRSLFLS